MVRDRLSVRGGFLWGLWSCGLGRGDHCRQDNGPMCKSPISTSFGPQNITVIMSQESHYWNVFLIGFTKNPFSTSSKLWLLGRIMHCWKGLDEEIAAPLESKETGDRKSTRLNSSHQIISYAVFCLKKKNKDDPDTQRITYYVI